MGLLVALIPLTLIEAAFVVHRLVLLERVRTGSGEVSPAQASAADARVFAMSRVTGTVGLAVVVLWLIWQFRSHKNLQTLGVAGLRYSPGLVVAFWLIPFTFPVMPYLTMRELWKASEPSTGASDWKMVRTPGLLPLWWFAFLAQFVLGALAAGFAADEVDTVSSAITSNYLSLAALLINAVAAGLAALLSRRIQGRMSAKRERVTLWQATPSLTG